MAVLDLDGVTRELDGELSVGSGSQAGWRVQNKDLAAKHFNLQNGDGRATVVPASPQSVVIVNGQQVPPQGVSLSAGDIICAGAAHFVYLRSETDDRPALPPPPAPAHLVDIRGRRAYPLNKRIVQIGREIGCNIAMRDTSVSRFHADIRGEGGQSVIYSMGSTGTKVNGDRMKNPQMLEEGDEIQIGSTTFTFTRGPLPPGVKTVELEEHLSDAINRRETVVHQRAVGATGPDPVLSSGSSMMPMLLGVVVVIAGVLAFIAMR